ncbi:SulP family inorganic anion transporter [Neisseria iguanae]|uniref:Sulfate transporter n=1 Tax=Neisseria iguanae TaxID=90242 RepID=A0A2P7U219_9NEIS|nr:SulP family inorganic anion transporter [Neisseria iguanae]PSJ80963.1 sulfate transporter [Neisseria iguanae]
MTQSFQLPLWLRRYDRRCLSQDIIAGLVVGIIVIPQSLGYAALAGLPPVYGLYSAIVPVLVYAWVGASNVNAVGPVAVTAIMTAHALQGYQHLPPEQYALLAAFLALLMGALLWLASLFRLGWITRFISQGVTAGFVTGASILVFISQIKFLIGANLSGSTIIDYTLSFINRIHTLHLPTLMVGALAFGLFFINRYYLKRWLAHWLTLKTAQFIVRLLPLIIMIAAVAFSLILDFQQNGIAVIEYVPAKLPHFVLPFSDGLHDVLSQILHLLPAAALIALIAFVSSNSVAASCARKRQEHFDTNQELKGLGWANMIGAFFQSFPVVGGFSRTAVNADAGAQTPLAGIISVGVMAAFLLLLAGYLEPLPYAVLAANIMVAILSMMDWDTLKRAARSDKTDVAAFLTACSGVLLFGLNTGLVLGVLVSFAGLIWQSSHPHLTVVGHTSDGHFRSITRYPTTQYSNLLIIRIDESIFYGNAQPIRHYLERTLAAQPDCKHLILMLSAVNNIDLTAQEMLLLLNYDLKKQNISLHFSDIKEPLADKLQHSVMMKNLSGSLFVSTAEAVDTLLKEESVWSPMI